MYGKASRAWSKCLAHSKTITAMAPPRQRSGAPLLTGAARGSCAAHDPRTMLEMGRAAVHTDKVTWVHVWEASSYLSASSDGTAALWDGRLPPKTRTVKRFEHGTGIVDGVLFGEMTMCTVSLVRSKTETGRRTGRRRCRAVDIKFWDLREGQATDSALIEWDNVDVSNVWITPSTDEGPEGKRTRQNFTMLSTGSRSSGVNSGGVNSDECETMIQGCNQRGVRQFTFDPLQQRTIVGGSFCRKGIILVSVQNQNSQDAGRGSVPQLAFAPTHLHTIKNDVTTTSKEQKSNETRLAVSTYNKKLAMFGARGDISSSLAMLEEMKKERSYPNAVSFEVVLRAMIRHRATPRVEIVLNHMEEMRTRPTNKTLIDLLRLASFTRTAPESQHLMRRLSTMGNPTVREVFIELLLVNPTKASIQLAFDMLMETITKKLGITRNIVHLFLKAAHDRRMTEQAFELLTAVNQRSKNKSGLKVDEYETVACMLAVIRETDKSLALLSQALDYFGVAASFGMACNLVRSFGRAGQLSATKTIEKMLQKAGRLEAGGGGSGGGGSGGGGGGGGIGGARSQWELVPNVLFSAAHMDAALSCAQPREAMRILNQLDVGTCKTGHKSFIPMYQSLIRFVSVLEAESNPDAQSKVIQLMQDMGMAVPYECLVSLLGCLALQKRITESMYLFKTLRHFKHEQQEEAEDRRIHAFSVLLSAVGRAGLPRVLHQLLRDVFPTTNVIRNASLQVIESAVESLRCVEEPRRAVEIWELSGRKMTRLVCNNVLLCYGLMCRVRDLTKLIETMRRKGCRPDDDTYAACVVGCVSAGRNDRAIYWMMEYCRNQERRGSIAVTAIAVWYHELQEKWTQRHQALLDSCGAVGGGGGAVADPDETTKSEKKKGMYSAIRHLLAKQQRLRRSSRAHPNIGEAALDLIERLVRTKQIPSAVQCLKQIFWIRGTTDPKAAKFVLQASVVATQPDKARDSLYLFSESKESKESKEFSATGSTMREETKSAVTNNKRDDNRDMDHSVEWILRSIEPRRLSEINSTLYGKCVERAILARDSSTAGYVAWDLINRYASSGGAMSSSIVEAMLRACVCERQSREDRSLVTSHLKHPLEIWQSADEFDVHPTDRSRLLLLKALVSVNEICEAMNFLRSFHAQGIRITPLTWMLRILYQADMLKDAMWICRVEKGRNQRLPEDIDRWLKKENSDAAARKIKMTVAERRLKGKKK